MKRLCFGTFAHVFRLCKLTTTTTRQLVGTMTRTVDPNCQYIDENNAPSVSRLINCKGQLSKGNIADSGSGVIKKPGDSISNVVNDAPKANKNDVVQEFQKNVIDLIDEDKKENMVLALLDIIEDDKVIDNEKKKSFELYMGQSKEDLLSKNVFILDEFLAGIFLYTTAAGLDNKSGKSTVEAITQSYIDGLTNDREIEVIDTAVENITTIDSIEVASQEDFTKYLSTARDYYRDLKTILYDKTPRDFYSFYVCNDLKHNEKILNSIDAKQLCLVSNFTIISGIGGLGKSMMMRHLLLSAIDSFDDLKLLPVFIPLKDYSRIAYSLHSYLYEIIKQFDESITEGQVKENLNKGNFILLFDGIDEVNSNDISTLVQEVKQFSIHYPKNYFVLSSRPFQQFVALSNFTELELQPFSKSQALKMITKFDFSREEEKLKESFYKQLDRELWLSHREFAENPLLLTIMLMTFEEYAEVPSKIYKFYEMAFETLIRKHDDTKLLKRDLKSNLPNDEIAEYFAKICFLSYKDEKYEMTESEFSNYFDFCQKNALVRISATDYLYDLSKNLCLLLQDGGKYHFIHRSFQEYFCAKNIKNGFERVSTYRKEAMSEGLIELFEHTDRTSDTVLDMLYDMVPEKVEEFIIIPFLESLFDNSLPADEDYWTFLEKVYSGFKLWHEYHEIIEYDDETDETYDESYYDFSIDDGGGSTVNSKLYFFIIHDLIDFDLDETTYYDNDEIMNRVPKIIEEFKKIKKDEENKCKPTYNEIGQLEYIEFSTFVKIEEDYCFSPISIRENSKKHSNLIWLINNEVFIYRKVYHALKDYLVSLKNKQQSIDNDWMEVFI